MWQDILIGLVGGLGLFLFGFHLMGQGFQKIAGERIHYFIEKTKHPVLLVMTGLVLTIILQDGNAALVVLIALLGAGLLGLPAAISLMLGINLGITVLAHFIAFRFGAYPLLAVGIGFLIYAFGKRHYTRYVGYTLVGFGLVFLGLNTLKAVMEPLVENFSLVEVLSRNRLYPLWGYLFGLVTTTLVQSNVAVIGLLQAAAGQTILGAGGGGFLRLSILLPVLLGSGLGLGTTATFTSYRANLTVKRAVWAQWLILLSTTLLLLPVVNQFAEFVHLVTVKLWTWTDQIKVLIFVLPSEPLPDAARLAAREIAVAHTLYNLLMVLVWLPLVPALARFVETRVNDQLPSQEEGAKDVQYLDEKFLASPALGLYMATKEILRTAQIATDMLYLGKIAFIKGQSSAIKDIKKKEDQVDELRAKITDYLAALLARNVLTLTQSRYLAGLIHVINDIERMADHAEHVCEFAEAKLEEKLPFSQLAMEELELLYGKVLDICKKAIDTLEQDDLGMAKQVLEREEAIDKIQEELRQNHINRLNQGRCWPGSGIIYLELIANLERVADHAANIAQMVLAGKEEMI